MESGLRFVSITGFETYFAEQKNTGTTAFKSLEGLRSQIIDLSLTLFKKVPSDSGRLLEPLIQVHYNAFFIFPFYQSYLFPINLLYYYLFSYSYIDILYKPFTTFFSMMQYFVLK